MVEIEANAEIDLDLEEFFRLSIFSYGLQEPSAEQIEFNELIRKELQLAQYHAEKTGADDESFEDIQEACDSSSGPASAFLVKTCPSLAGTVGDYLPYALSSMIDWLTGGSIAYVDKITYCDDECLESNLKERSRPVRCKFECVSPSILKDYIIVSGEVLFEEIGKGRSRQTLKARLESVSYLGSMAEPYIKDALTETYSSLQRAFDMWVARNREDDQTGVSAQENQNVADVVDGEIPVAYE